MNYLATNPFCPYCYVNDRVFEDNLPDFDDSKLMLIPMLLANEATFSKSEYLFYQERFEKDTLLYAKQMNQTKLKFFKLENVGPSKLVFKSYYYLRQYGLGLKFYHEVSRRFYESDFNFSEIEQLATIVKLLNGDVAAYYQAMQDEKYEDLYIDYLKMTDDYNIQVVPSYYIEGNVYSDIIKSISFLK